MDTHSLLEKKLCKYYPTEDSECLRATYDLSFEIACKAAEMLGAKVDFKKCFLARPLGNFDAGAVLEYKNIKIVVKPNFEEEYLADIIDLLDINAPDLVAFFDVEQDAIVGYADLHQIKRDQVFLAPEQDHIYIKLVPTKIDLEEYQPAGDKLLSKSERKLLVAFARAENIDLKALSTPNSGLLLGGLLFAYYDLCKTYAIINKPLSKYQALYYAIYLPLLKKKDFILSADLQLWIAELVKLKNNLQTRLINDPVSVVNWIEKSEKIKNQIKSLNPQLIDLLEELRETVAINEVIVNKTEQIIERWSKYYLQLFEGLQQIAQNITRDMNNKMAAIIKPLNLSPAMSKTKKVPKNMIKTNRKKLLNMLNKSPNIVSKLIDALEATSLELKPSEKQLLFDYLNDLKKLMKEFTQKNKSQTE